MAVMMKLEIACKFTVTIVKQYTMYCVSYISILQTMYHDLCYNVMYKTKQHHLKKSQNCKETETSTLTPYTVISKGNSNYSLHVHKKNMFPVQLD